MTDEVTNRAKEMLSQAAKEACKRHPRVCSNRGRSAEHAQAFMNCVTRVGQELFPDFDQVLAEYGLRE